MQFDVDAITFYQLHLLFDKHDEWQNALVDAIAERVQLLGGVALAMAPDVAPMNCRCGSLPNTRWTCP